MRGAESVRSALHPGLTTLGRLAIAALVVLTVWTPLSRTLVRAAATSTPGQALYPLKIHVERTQVTSASEPDVRVALALAFLGERVAEAKALINIGSPIPADSITDAQVLVNLLLRSVAETPNSMLPEALQVTRIQLLAYEDSLTQLRMGAAPIYSQTIGGMSEAYRRGVLIVEHALADPTGFSAAYRAGRPELFLLPGESPLGPPTNAQNSTVSDPEERPNEKTP